MDDNDLFVIDENTGAITLAAGTKLDYESGTTSYTITVTATPVSTLDLAPTATNVDDVMTLTYTINVTDANDAPTGASFMRAANFATTVNVGTITATGDPDSGDTFTYTLVAGAGDTDNGLFALDMNSGALTFNTAASTGAGLGVRKALGETYEIRVQVTDSGGATFTQSFIIGEGTAQVDGQYSGYATDGHVDGDGLLPENAYIHNLGTVSFASNPDVISLVDGSGDNSDFFLMTTAAAVTIGATSDPDLTLDVSSATGSEFVVLTINASNVVTGMGLKATLAAGDLVVGRLNTDTTELTSLGLDGFTLALASNTITMSGYTAGTTTIAAQSNQLLYIGTNSGDFESADTITVEIEAIDELRSGASQATLNWVEADWGKYIYLLHVGTSSQVDTKYTNHPATPPTNSFYIGQIAADGQTIATFNPEFIQDGLTKVTNIAQYSLASNSVIARTTTTTENYIIRLADVAEN